MIDPRFNAFYLLTGTTFVAFASGFGVCMFNFETIDACVATSQSWVPTFERMGMHIIQWAVAIGHAAFNQ